MPTADREKYFGVFLASGVVNTQYNIIKYRLGSPDAPAEN
jgi:hypothetical protein